MGHCPKCSGWYKGRELISGSSLRRGQDDRMMWRLIATSTNYSICCARLPLRPEEDASTSLLCKRALVEQLYAESRISGESTVTLLTTCAPRFRILSVLAIKLIKIRIERAEKCLRPYLITSGRSLTYIDNGLWSRYTLPHQTDATTKTSLDAFPY